jgi:hypothetical protein
MSVQSHKDNPLEWKTLSSEVKEQLRACGVPPEVTESELSWSSVLERGDDPGSGWSPHKLPVDKARALLEFLRREAPEAEPTELHKNLEKVVSGE